MSGRDARHSLVVLCLSGFLVFAAGRVPPSVGFLVPPSLSAVLGLVPPSLSAVLGLVPPSLSAVLGLVSPSLSAVLGLVSPSPSAVLGLPLSLKSVAYQPEPLSRNPDAETSRRRSVFAHAGQSVRAGVAELLDGLHPVAATQALIFVDGHREALRSRMRSP